MLFNIFSACYKHLKCILLVLSVWYLISLKFTLFIRLLAKALRMVLKTLEFFYYSKTEQLSMKKPKPEKMVIMTSNRSNRGIT